MPLDEEQVRHVAQLARLRLSDSEVADYAKQLSAIIGYVDKLNELDTTNVPPTTHPLPIHNVFREDVVLEGCGREQALANAPDAQDSFFRVPKVL